MIEALQKGDEVVTAGGVGRITKLSGRLHQPGDRAQHGNQRAESRRPGSAAQGHDQKHSVNRYPTWGYALIALAMAPGFLYTLPNFFGESPAVQVSSAKATVKVDPALLQKVQDVLRRRHPLHRRGVRPERHPRALRRHRHAAQGEGPDPQHPEPGRRAAGDARGRPECQLRRRAQPAARIADSGWRSTRCRCTSASTCAAAHFLLQVDMQAATTKRLESIAADIRSQLREKNVRHGGVTREGQTLRVRFRDAACATARARRSRPTCPTSRCRARRRPGPPARRHAEARGDQAQPGVRAQAEHHHAAQPHQRARRGRARDPAAGRRAHRGAASRRAGRDAREAPDRAHRHARDPHGGRGVHEPGDAGRGGARPGALRHRTTSRGTASRSSCGVRWCSPATGSPTPSRASTPDQRARRTCASTARARASSRKSRARTSTSAWRSC